EVVGDHAVLEDALATILDAELVAPRIPLAAALPADGGPFVPDGPVNREGSRGGRPVDGAAVGEMVEPTDPVGGPGLVGHRVTEEACRPPQRQVLVSNGATDLVTARGRRAVRRATRGGGARRL